MKQDGILKRILVIPVIVLLSFAVCNAQNTIHVYSVEIPWISGTFQKENGKIYSINEAIANAAEGDEIIIHEGIYREKVDVNKSFLNIHNFNGDYVLITGCEPVSGWKDATGMAAGVKEADVSAIPIEAGYSQLFVDGTAQMMARHPNNTLGQMMAPLADNGGYARLSQVYKDAGVNADCYAALANTTIPGVSLEGGIFRGLTGKNRNNIFATITANSGNQITFKAINKGQWKDSPAIAATKHKVGWGFVMHKNLIDIPGEWFLDNQKLYYMPEPGTSMKNLRVEIQVRSRVLELTDVNNVTLSGLNFVAGNVRFTNVSMTKASYCSWRYLQPFWTPINYGDNDTDETGIYLTNASDNLFSNCYLAHTWGQGFYIASGDNNTFENCIIKDLGWIGTFSSAIWPGGNTTIRNCTFGDAGRFHLRIRKKAKIDVYDSDFYGAMMMGEDAGPIEATSTGSLLPLDLQGSVFAYNKIHDCHGIPVFDGGYAKDFVVGFYMEDTHNYTVHHNLVYDMTSNYDNVPLTYTKGGAFLYLGPRYNYMDLPVNYYNNTIWNYDKAINIWHIEVDNWQQLGMQHTGGAMMDGHFENNIFQNGPVYGLNWSKQVLNSSGGRVDWVKVDNPPSISTTDFSAYVQHCDTIGYHFNAQNNVIIDKSAVDKNFVDAAGGDFNLTQNATAKGAGKVIQDITSGTTPDCGALEGDDRVMHAGASLQVPEFMETIRIVTSLDGVENRDHLQYVYPNPVDNLLAVVNVADLPEHIAPCIFDVSGQKMRVKHYWKEGQKIMLEVTDLPHGVYFLRLNDTSKMIRFVKK